MNEKRHAIRFRLNKVFQEQFDEEELEIFENMTAADIEEWDSLMHIVLVVAIEKEFDVKLVPAEVEKLENVGAMIKLLEDRAQ